MERLGRNFVNLMMLAAATLSLAAFQSVAAQDNAFSDLFASTPGLPQKSGSAEVSATLQPVADAPGEALLSVTVKLPKGATTYGLDAKTAQKKTVIIVTESKALTAAEESFRTDREPKMEFVEALGKTVGKFYDSVSFQQRFRIEAGAEPGSARVKGTIEFLYCDDQSCTPVKEDFAAALAGTPVAASTTSPAGATNTESLKWGYRTIPMRRRGGNTVQDPVRVQFELKPENAKAGEDVKLCITMELDDDWHTYSTRPGKDQIENPTEISLTRIDGLTPDGEWIESPPAEVVQQADSESRLFSHRVTFSRYFKRTDAQEMGVTGDLVYQICEEGKQCLPQKSLPFALGDGQPVEVVKDARPAITLANVANQSEEPTSFDVEGEAASGSLLTWLSLAFLGGLTLNIMPCVLPVLAIKILSFVQQAGENRGRILALNLVYTLGVVFVFLSLATLAATASYSWGALFQREWFRVSMVLVLYVVGLNLLGAFEVVLPGTVAQAAGSGHREGLLGAFMTGIFATLLATPCSTGWMAAAFTWSLKQSTPVIFLVWGTMGIGMAMPYLLIGFFPSLVQWLPRPGMWMVRFKQLSAFAMFGAAIFFLQSVDQRNILPVLVGALGLGLGLWMIGSMYDRETPLRRKSAIRLAAVLLGGGTCLLGGWMHYEATVPMAHQLDWKKFETEAFVSGRKSGTPMLVDFTADWCAICKTNERRALNQRETADFIRDNGIVTFMADWTDENEEIRKWLNQFGQDSVPLTVIVPPNPKAKLITLSGLYSREQLLEKLQEAMNAGEADANKPVQMTAVAAPGTSVAAE